MPVYASSPIGRNVQQAVPGRPAYMWGSYNAGQADTRMNITSVKLASPTAQVTGTVVEGNVPVVGQKISIQGAVPAYFNVTGATITAVSAAATPDVGVYTVSFALTNSNIGTTSSPGVAVMPVPEVGEAVVAGASQAVAIQANTDAGKARVVRFDVSFPVAAGSVTVVAQSAAVDDDSQYADLGTVAQLTGGVLSGGSTIYDSITANFVRLINRSPAGVSTTTIVGKVLV